MEKVLAVFRQDWIELIIGGIIAGFFASWLGIGGSITAVPVWSLGIMGFIVAILFWVAVSFLLGD